MAFRSIDEAFERLKELIVVEAQAQVDKLRGEERDSHWPLPVDTSWCLDADGNVQRITWFASLDLFVRNRFAQGNIFRTEAEATRERDRRALIAELRRHPKACGFEIGGGNCYLMFDCLDGWIWDSWNSLDVCPASGYFSEHVEGLIEQYGSRLDLLRCA